MSLTPLTTGAIKRMLNVKMTVHPILQILDIKSTKGKDRHRLLVSDGQDTYGYAEIPSHMKNLVDSEELTKYCIIRALKFTVPDTTSNHPISERILTLLDVKILHKGDEVRKQIGNPVALEADEKNNDKTEPDEEPVAYSTIRIIKAENSTIDHFLTQQDTNQTNDSVYESGDEEDNSSYNKMDNIVPITSLTINTRFAESIKVKVTTKSDPRFKEDNPTLMPILKMYLGDESGEIEATVFGELVAHFDKLIQEQKCYKITNFRLKPAHEEHCILPHPCEILFNKDTIVEECTDEVIISSKHSELNIVPISSVKEYEIDSNIDVAAVCLKIIETEDQDKKEVVLVDKSASISLVVWRDQAERFKKNVKSIVVIKKARVKSFNGVFYLTLSDIGNIKFIPEIPEVKELFIWYLEGGFKNITLNETTCNE